MTRMGRAGSDQFAAECRFPLAAVARWLLCRVTFLAVSSIFLLVPNELARAEKPVVDVKRSVSLPPFEVLSNQSGRSPSRYDYSKVRYTVVLGISTWSQRARELAIFFRDREEELKKRNVALVGAFTHDSEADILKFREELKIGYYISRVSLDFVTKMLNPKIPTIWISDHTGQIVYRLVRPSQQGVEHSYELLRSWTDF